MSDSNWMTERHGIPHKDGKVRFYLIGAYEDVYEYLGWYDMTDWDKGWEKLWADAQASRNGDEDFQVLRHDQLIDLKTNIDNVLEKTMEVEGETTWLWWHNQEKKSKGEMK